MMLLGFSCGAAGDWMKTQPLLMLRPPSKALVSESPNAHMRDLELDSMSQAREVSKYVDKVGISSVSEERTGWGFSFLGFSFGSKKVSPHIGATRIPPLNTVCPFLASFSDGERYSHHGERQRRCGNKER